MKTNLFIVLFILAYCGGVCAQDLSENEMAKAKDSINKLLDLAYDADLALDIQSCIELSSKAIELATKVGDEKSVYHAYNTIGINHEKISEFDDAEYSYKKALNIALKLKNDTLKAWSYNNLGNVYSDGYKKIDSGLEYYEKALKLAKKIKDTFEISIPVINIGWTYIDNKEYEKALPYLEEGYKYAYDVKNGDASAKVHTNYLLARYYRSKKQYSKSYNYLQKAIEIAKQKSMVVELADIYKEATALYEDQGLISKAFSALKEYLGYKALLTKKERVKQMQIARAQFHYEENLRNVKKLEKERQLQETIAKRSRIITLISVLVVIILFILLLALYKNYMDKNKLSSILQTQNDTLEKAKQEAEKLSQLKTQFISTVSHELRTPLYGVVGLTSLLLEESNLSKKEHQYLNSLKFSGDYLLNLINDVLQLSKIESNKLKLEETDFSINTLFNNIVNSFEYQLEQTKIKIHVIIDESIPETLKGDMVRLSQILINLIGNSIKFTPKGDIWFRAINASEPSAKEKLIIRFEVEDNGIGIPKEKQKEIFENFSQVDRDHIDFQGTGLGLSIVKKLVNLFGAEIELVSERGKGSKFSFAIAFKRGNSADVPKIKKMVEQSSRSNNKILIVEDNKINQIVTQNILSKQNFETSIVDNGLDAIEAVRNNNFDLVLMDLNMPRMNGFDATKKIREFNKKIPIIALTAVAIEEIKAKVFESGLTDIINKPYDNQEFYMVILKNIKKTEESYTKTNP
ncbi:response regulator [Ascidiimonas sp. W6]|uniref:response regulator n=1 Tax=Ascidiimonas meishanensis TaxID=3128903 RepID=UPI0030EC65B7